MKGPFDSFPKTVVKTIVMMIGEYEYEGIFEFFGQDYLDRTESNEWNNTNFYHKVAYVMFVAFMLIMTIIVSNMLVGLAVDDIKGTK